MCTRHVGCLLLVLGACATPTTRTRADLTTTAERSQYLRTGRYEEAVRLCHDFATSYAEATCVEIGTTAGGRPLLALTIAKQPDLPVVLIQAGIHAGEIEGKDAGFAALRDVLDGKLAPGVLDHVRIVFVPVLNPDGHERFGANHRPNQRGPEEMGFRVTSQRLNLNRDYVKLDAPETRSVVGLLRDLDPVLYVDLHATDGAKFEQDIAVLVGPVAPRIDELEETAAALSQTLQARMTELGHLPVPFYPSFNDPNDPQSGFSVGEAPPRFANYYAATRDRLAILVETHSWRTYQERAQSTYHALQAIFEQATTQAAHWREVSDASTQQSERLGGTDVPLVWSNLPTSHPIDFRGYAYELRTSAISGLRYVAYDETKPEIWTIPVYDQYEPAIVVHAPRGGYIVDGGFAARVTPILDAHGIQYSGMIPSGPVDIEAFRATTTSFDRPVEGRQRATLAGEWAAESRTLEQGAVFVPLAQPNARLILHLFEPASPDSLAQWGFFNAAFEEKEYMEPYIAEEEAARMIAEDPALGAEFNAALSADPALAADPIARLYWFYKRHPAWDERVNLVPVYKVTTP